MGSSSLIIVKRIIIGIPGFYNMIDISFDFRSDSKGRNPDTYSPTFNAFHRAFGAKSFPMGR